MVKMTRFELEQRYKEYGCNNFRLRTLDDLKNIHGFDVTELSGYDGLPQEQRELFDKTIIKFYNTQGLDRRNRLQPKNVNFVYEKDYAMPVDGEYLVVGTDVFVIEKDGTLGKRLHRHVYDKNADFQKCMDIGKCRTSSYLRFELKGDQKCGGGWYHFTPNGDWY